MDRKPKLELEVAEETVLLLAFTDAMGACSDAFPL
jgi:hypothetical protein